MQLSWLYSAISQGAQREQLHCEQPKRMCVHLQLDVVGLDRSSATIETSPGNVDGGIAQLLLSFFTFFAAQGSVGVALVDPSGRTLEIKV